MNSKPEFPENKFSPKSDYSNSFVFDIFRDDKFSIQNLTCWKTFISKSLFLGKSLHHFLILFFREFHFKLWFSMERLASNHAFENKQKSEEFVVFCGAYWVKTFFFRCEFFIEIWFLNKNWTQKLTFWKKFFLQNMIIRKVFYYKICRNKKFSIQNLTFWNFFFSKFHCAGKRLLQKLILFGKLHFKLWFSLKKFAAKSCLLKWARKVNNLLFCTEQIESKPYFLDVMSLSKSDFSMKIEFKI